MIKCPNCGNEVNGEDFCSRCGFKFKKHYCPKCGFETSIKDEFCQKCGVRINNENVVSFNKIKLFPFILGIISILILLFSSSKIVFILCLLLAGFLFGFKSNKAYINSILVGVIPAIFFIVITMNIYYLLMCFIPPIIGCYVAIVCKKRYKYI